jgi:superfamily II DNA or RNA helicase
MADLTITKASHYFKIHKISARGRDAAEAMARRYIQFGLERRPGGRFTKAAKCVYAAATHDRREYRFHINQYDEFIQEVHRAQIPMESVEIVERAFRTPKVVELPIRPEWEDRDYQIPAINYIVSDEPPTAKFLALQTGKGKSYCTMRACSMIGDLPVYIMRPMFIEKWIIDFHKTYELKQEELLVVRGADQLQALLFMASEGDLPFKVIVISNKTIQRWITLYEQIGDTTLDLGYACRPDEMYELLKAGIRAIDEVHLDFHLNFKIDLYTHVKKSVSLSATLRSDDPFMNKVYEVAYPKSMRYKGPAYDKYIAAVGLVYRVSQPDKVRTKQYGGSTYSHHAFEESIMKSKHMLPNYIDLINRVVKNEYLANYKRGQRCLVYGASIDFCGYLAEQLQRLHPNLVVKRYCEDDPYENLMESDICVSTVLSAGTGVDIPDLTTVVLTHAIRSTQSNIQGFGRLRKLKDGTTPRFIWMSCEDVPKHMEYHEQKEELMNELAISCAIRYVGVPI